MWNRPRVPAGVALAICCCLSSALLVQPALAADAKAADAKADATEAAAAMERAKRLAANPLRVILEAGKVRRRVAADADAAALAPAAPATVAGAVPAPNTSGAAALNAPSMAAVAARSDDTPPPAAVRQSPMRTLSAAPIATAMAGQVPAMVATDRLTAPETIATAVLPPTGAAPAATPRLIDMVEPAIPVRVLDELGRTVEVVADLTIRPDGTVAQVQLVPPVNRTLSRYVMAAMERWRFAPLPAEQLHRVQLVLNGQ